MTRRGQTAATTMTAKRAGSVLPPARERILDGAENLFSAHGFQATSTQRLADEAGVPNGLIFYYFKTKQGLLATLIAERGILPELRELIASTPEGDLRETLTEIGRRMLAFLERKQRLSRILLSESLTNAAVAELFRDTRHSSQAVLADYLRRIAAGRFDAHQATSLAQVFTHAILFAHAFDRPADPETFLDDLVSMVLGPPSAHA